MNSEDVRDRQVREQAVGLFWFTFPFLSSALLSSSKIRCGFRGRMKRKKVNEKGKHSIQLKKKVNLLLIKMSQWVRNGTKFRICNLICSFCNACLISSDLLPTSFYFLPKTLMTRYWGAKWIGFTYRRTSTVSFHYDGDKDKVMPPLFLARPGIVNEMRGGVLA